MAEINATFSFDTRDFSFARIGVGPESVFFENASVTFGPGELSSYDGDFGTYTYLGTDFEFSVTTQPFVDNGEDRVAYYVDFTAGTVQYYSLSGYADHLVLTELNLLASAVSAAALTATSDDDTALLATQLQGDDFFRGGVFEDAMDLPSAFADYFDGMGGDDLLYGDYGPDHLLGNIGNDTIFGEEHADTLDGGDGNDALNGGDDADTLIGGLGRDLLIGGTNPNGQGDVMTGGDGNDVHYVDSIADIVVEANGAGTGADEVRTTVSYSVVSQFVEAVTLEGSGSINAVGNSLANTITGNTGNNALDGRGGTDTMIGGEGNDTYYVDNVLDRTIEANVVGNDTVYTTVSKSFVDQFVEVIQLSGSGNINTTGNSLANTIVGNGANNAINGRGGVDRLTGGYGNDSFVFNTAPAPGNIDIIIDFRPVDDTIQLDDALFSALDLGTLSADAFRSNSTGLAQDADDRIIYNSAKGQLYYDSNGNAAGGNVLFADLASGLAVTNADFHIV